MSTSTINARDPKLTLRLERALLAMEKRAEEQLSIRRFANVYSALGTLAELQAWCDEHNGGSCHLPHGTVERVKRELGIISSGKVGAMPAAPRPQQAVPPKVTRPGIAQAPAAPAAAPVAPARPERKSAPWLSVGGQPRKHAFANHRSRLAKIAAGQTDLPVDKTWYAFAKKWFGGPRPTAAQAQEFLAWMGEASQTISVRPASRGGPIPEGVRWHSPDIGAGEMFVVKQGSIAPAAAARPAAGWLDLEVVSGRRAEHAARYAGTAKHPSLSIAGAATRAAGLKAGERVHVRYHPELGRLALVPSPAGLTLLGQRHAGVRLRSGALRGLLGTAEICFAAAAEKLLPDSVAEFCAERREEVAS